WDCGRSSYSPSGIAAPLTRPSPLARRSSRSRTIRRAISRFSWARSALINLESTPARPSLWPNIQLFFKQFAEDFVQFFLWNRVDVDIEIVAIRRTVGLWLPLKFLGQAAGNSRNRRPIHQIEHWQP